MFKHKRIISMLMALALCVALIPSVFASTGTKTLDVSYRDIKIVLNGTRIAPKDANGNPIGPFVSAGTTYLPVRGISEALGLIVNWNGDTNTVYLNTKAGEHDPEPAQPGYVGTTGSKKLDVAYRDIKIALDGRRIDLKDAAGNTVEPFVSEGTTYLPLRAVASALGLTVGWDGATSTVTLDGKPASSAPVGNYVVENGVLTDIQGFEPFNPIVIPEGVRSVSPTVKEKFEKMEDPFWDNMYQYRTDSKEYKDAKAEYQAAFPAIIIPSTLETLTGLPVIPYGNQVHYHGTEMQWNALKIRTLVNDQNNSYANDVYSIYKGKPQKPHHFVTFGNTSTTPTTILDFTDLAPDHPNYDAIQTIVYAANLTSENGKFRPDDTITYGEMAWILAGLTYRHHSQLTYRFTNYPGYSFDATTLDTTGWKQIAMRVMQHDYNASPYADTRNDGVTAQDNYTLMDKAVTRGPALCYLYNLLSEQHTLGTYEDPHIRKILVDPTTHSYTHEITSELTGKVRDVSESDIPDWDVIVQNDVGTLYSDEIKAFELDQLESIRQVKWGNSPSDGFYFKFGRLQEQDAVVWERVAHNSVDQTLLNKNAILAMYRLGLRFGDDSDMTCDPYKTVTRGEFCQLLYDAGVTCNRYGLSNLTTRHYNVDIDRNTYDNWPAEIDTLPENRTYFDWPETVPKY